MFCPQKVEKKHPKKLHIWQLGGFFLCSPDCPKQPRTSFPFYKFFYPTISGRISGRWPFLCPFGSDGPVCYMYVGKKSGWNCAEKRIRTILKQWRVRFLDQTIFHFKLKRVGGQDSSLKWGNYFWINIFYEL